MKKLLAILVVGLFANNAAQAATLTVLPSATAVNYGDTFTVNVGYDSEGNGLGLGTFDFDLTFDSSLFSLQSSSFGTGLDVLGLGSLQSTTPGSNTQNFYELSFDSVSDIVNNQASKFNLVTLTFKSIATGSATFGILNTAVLGDANGNSIAAQINNSATVAAVPEAETYAMLLAGLGVLGFATRRKMAA